MRRLPVVFAHLLGAVLSVTLVCSASIGLSAQNVRSIFMAVPAEGRSVSVGHSVDGTLSSEDLLDPEGRIVQVWLLAADAGSDIQVTLESSDFDPLLRVVGSGLGTGLEDDDGGPGLTAQLCFAVPEGSDGLRVVVASVGGETGAFRLTASTTTGSGQGTCSDSENPFTATASLDELPVAERRISSGQSLEGRLTSSDAKVFGFLSQAWAIEGTAGQSVTLDLRSTEFDSYLMFSGPGAEGLSDDDSGGGCNARITVTFPETAEYRVVVSTVGQAGGAFSLAASAEPGDPGTSPCAPMGSGETPDGNVDAVAVVGELAIGDVVGGELTGEEPTFQAFPSVAWTLRGQAGLRMTIEMRSTELDGLLFFAGPGFSEPLADDDSADESNARLCVELTEDGEYKVIASRYSYGTGTHYTLSVRTGDATNGCERFDAPPAAVREALLRLPSEGRTLVTGETAQGALTDDDAHVIGEADTARAQAWVLQATPGGTVWVDLLSDDFDPFLTIVGPSIDGMLASDDFDDSLGWNSRIEVSVPGDGLVTLIVESYSAHGRGTFRLRASIDPPPLEANVGGGGGALSTTERVDPSLLSSVLPTDDHLLEPGFEIDGVLLESDVVVADGERLQAWQMHGQAGDRLVLELVSEDFDPILFVQGPGIGSPLVNDDGGSGLDSRLEVTLAEAGTFTVYVGSVNGEVGSFRLRVLRRRN